MSAKDEAHAAYFAAVYRAEAKPWQVVTDAFSAGWDAALAHAEPVRAALEGLVRLFDGNGYGCGGDTEDGPRLAAARAALTAAQEQK